MTLFYPDVSENVEQVVTDFVEKPDNDEALQKARTPAAWIDTHGVQSNGREYLASMGIYLFNRDLLVDLLESSAHEDFGKDIFPMAIKERHVQTHLFDGYWEDIGTIRAFFDANLALADTNAPFKFADRKHPIFTRARFLPSTRFEESAISHSLIADGCTIGPGSRIENSVLGVRTQIGSNVTVRNCVIMGADEYADGESDAGSVVRIDDNVCMDGALVDKNVYVGQNVRIVASEAADGDGDYDEVAVRDGIAVVKKNARIPEGWSFG